MNPWLIYALGVLTPVAACLIFGLWLWTMGQLCGPEPEDLWPDDDEVAADRARWLSVSEYHLDGNHMRPVCPPGPMDPAQDTWAVHAVEGSDPHQGPLENCDKPLCAWAWRCIVTGRWEEHCGMCSKVLIPPYEDTPQPEREWVSVSFQASPRPGESVTGADLREVAARLGDAFGFELITGVTVVKVWPRHAPVTDAFVGGSR